jgi:serine/threonine-protein kinase
LLANSSLDTLISTMRSASAASTILDVLADPRLLPRAQFEQLVEELLPRCDNWRILAHELVYRQWLTPYQATLVLYGRGQELAVGSYVLLEPIGEGAMGQVFQARNWKLDTRVAVKVIRRERAADPRTTARFLREVRALGAIHHPHIVHALDADIDSGRLYCAMEYVPGTDLGRLLRDRGALSIEIACRYAAQIADALRHISGRGLVHRDVKPSNILVTEDGTAVKLADLGLARFDRPDLSAGHLTQVGMMIGTPDYVAPEQVRDSHRVDIRSDLYSLGCTLYHMLAGRPPFGGLGAAEKLYHHDACDPNPVEQLRSDVPPIVAQVVRTLLAKKPRDRYQDPAEVVSLLRPYLHSAGDTMTDAAAPTAPGLPVPVNDWPLPRTEEIPQHGLFMMTQESVLATAAPEPWRDRANRWLDRFHWLIAAVIAGLALGMVIGR